MRVVVITDLDGTLLDHDTYSFHDAAPALHLLQSHNIPLVCCTSKTRAETELWRRRLGNHHPFIVENGGAAVTPKNYFQFSPTAITPEGEYMVQAFGRPYNELRKALAAASQAARCAVRGFGDMDEPEVAKLCGIPLEQARLAKMREYDEPFLILEPERAERLLSEIRQMGFESTRGGRFHHITGGCDKAGAVRFLLEAFRRDAGNVETIGLGDGLNDASFLNIVDHPILIQSAVIEELRARVPGGRPTSLPGAKGWNAAILHAVHKCVQRERSS